LTGAILFVLGLISYLRLVSPKLVAT